jgi:hypothetical protein
MHATYPANLILLGLIAVIQMVKNKICEAPYHVIISNHPVISTFLRPDIPLSTLLSSCMWGTKFHPHAKQ